MGDIKVTATFTLPGFTSRAAKKFIEDGSVARVVRDLERLIGKHDFEWAVQNLSDDNAEFIGEDDSRYTVEVLNDFGEYIVRDNLGPGKPIIAGSFVGKKYADAVCDTLNDLYEGG